MLDFGYYNMDCMDGMKEFPDKYFDLAIVDPEYGRKEHGGRNRSGYVKQKNGTTKTLIRVPIKKYPIYHTQIQSYIALYGGREKERNSRNIYFVVDEDLLNERK